MRRLAFATSVFLLMPVLLLSGCSDQSSNSSERFDDRVREVSETVDQEIQAGKEAKEAYVNRAEEELASLNTEINELKKKIARQSGRTADRLKKKWTRLNNKRQKLQKDLDELKARTKRDWKELKQIVDEQLNRLNESYENLKNELVLG